MRSIILVLLITTLMSKFALAGPSKIIADDRQQIEQTLNDYIQGTSYSNPKQIDRAFAPQANLYLTKKDAPHWIVPATTYRSWFENKELGKFTGRIGEIISIDIADDVAMAKVEIMIPKGQTRFVDYMLLKKLNNQWQIIGKTASKAASNQHGKRILFIVSSHSFHGNSKMRAGTSFSELVNAYEEFKKAGYTVDFMSPDGGAISLAYIDTSLPSHKKYIYDHQFMHALAHTKTPQQVNAKDYRAVHYVGGSNAMYGVHDNPQIAAISMEIYEQHNGIVSSVCHGTAGIADLRLSNGKYLIDGKRISGYPTKFENTKADYFQHFPFDMTKHLQRRGANFEIGQRGKPFAITDGRVITGQNYQSSSLVAKQIIEKLKQLDAHN
ncbi:MAG: nuclear transport factor 2 family protein [Psychrobium sp.]